MAQQPHYKTFTIPKKGGGERQIESPGTDIKRVLGRLNRYLQSVYYFEKSVASYGFVVGVRNDEDRRNVLTNAQKHIGKPYLLNIDLKDFFHSVTREQVLRIFANKPFRLKRNLPPILADLVTYQGRLPMGAPTSPVLSNLACRELDQELVAFAKAMRWTFTRYADDMSFSSEQPIPDEKIDFVKSIIQKASFEVNERKVKIFGPEEDKIVTGLLVTDKVALAPDYIPLLEAEIEKLKSTLQAQNEQGRLSTNWVEQYKQQVRGRLNFAGFILQRNSEMYIELKNAYHAAVNPPQEEFGAVNWRSFPYNL